MCCYWQQHPHQVQRQLVPCSRQRFIILVSSRLLLDCVMSRCLQFAVHHSSIHGVLRLEFFIVLVSGRVLNVAIDYINNIISRLIQLTVQHRVTRTTDFLIFSVDIVILNISLFRTDNNKQLNHSLTSSINKLECKLIVPMVDIISFWVHSNGRRSDPMSINILNGED